LWEIKSQKCTWKSWESYFPHTAPWGATSRWNSISRNPTWIFSREIWQPSLTSMVNGFIRIYPAWKKDRASNGIQIYWLVTAQRLYETPKQEHKRQKMTKWICDVTFIYCYVGYCT
jgi:hypothetical protein